MTDTVRVESHKRAKRHGCSAPYLARFYLRPDMVVEREFARRFNIGNGVHGFEMSSKVSDVFECRRFVWCSDRERYVGGMAWLIHDEDGIVPVLREEAIAFLKRPRIRRPNVSAEWLQPATARPILPVGIFTPRRSGVPLCLN